MNQPFFLRLAELFVGGQVQRPGLHPHVAPKKADEISSQLAYFVERRGGVALSFPKLGQKHPKTAEVVPEILVLGKKQVNHGLEPGDMGLEKRENNLFLFPHVFLEMPLEKLEHLPGLVQIPAEVLLALVAEFSQ